MNMSKEKPEMYGKCKARYISDKTSIFFEKGKIYDAFIPKCDGGNGLLAFYFSESEMAEEGFYALPANRFEIVKN